MEEFTQTATCPQNAESNLLAPIAPANPRGNAREENIGSPLAIIRASLDLREFKLLTNLSTFFAIDLTSTGYGVSAAILVAKDAFQNQDFSEKWIAALDRLAAKTAILSRSSATIELAAIVASSPRSQ